MTHDLRTRLESIARGESDEPVPATAVVLPVVEQHQGAFRAWARFARPAAGEPLAAPAESLAPLP